MVDEGQGQGSSEQRSRSGNKLNRYVVIANTMESSEQRWKYGRREWLKMKLLSRVAMCWPPDLV